MAGVVGTGEPDADAVEVVPGRFTRDGAYASMATLLARDRPPRYVVAGNDVMAVGAMAPVRDAGLPVPDDVAVAGFDDIPTLRDVTPPLTTVALPLTETGRRAMELATEPGPDGLRIQEMAGTVVVRASTPDVSMAP